MGISCSCLCLISIQQERITERSIKPIPPGRHESIKYDGGLLLLVCNYCILLATSLDRVSAFCLCFI